MARSACANLSRFVTSPRLCKRPTRCRERTEKVTAVIGLISLPPQFDGTTLPEIFERVALAYPENISVTDEISSLTYRELNDRAQRLALALVREGVERDSLVGLCLERSCDLIVGVLGILKAGGAYVPLDPAYPEAHREYVVSHGGLKLVVTNAATADRCAGCRTIDVHAGEAVDSTNQVEFVSDVDASNLAYVIFTSGTTGRPKGVMIEHRNVVRLFSSTRDIFDFGSNDVWCLFHSIAFDYSVWELWGALLFGGRLIIPSDETVRNPAEYRTLLVHEGVTVLNQTPTGFRSLITEDSNHPITGASKGLMLRYVVFGGERLDAHMLTPWVARHGLEKPKLVNMYGITETTVHTTWKVLSNSDITSVSRFSPIGAPIADMKIDIVDADGTSVFSEDEGLIYVTGAGLARGYIGQNKLTHDRFVQRTNAEGLLERWYNSGDIGMRLKDGTYAYVGRADRLIKIRGYRVEPAEIEVCLRRYPGLLDATVLAAEFGDSDPRLVGYVIVDEALREQADLPSALRSFVAQALPHYMVPSSFILLDAIPTTVNGKQDTNALLALLRDKLNRTEHRINEKHNGAGLLHVIWAEILALETIDEDADFFDLGGTSFSLIHLFNRVNKAFDSDLRVEIFRDGATLSALLSALRDKDLLSLELSPNH